VILAVFFIISVHPLFPWYRICKNHITKKISKSLYQEVCR